VSAQIDTTTNWGGETGVAGLLTGTDRPFNISPRANRTSEDECHKSVPIFMARNWGGIRVTVGTFSRALQCLLDLCAASAGSSREARQRGLGTVSHTGRTMETFFSTVKSQLVDRFESWGEREDGVVRLSPAVL
jgi:hypothetical protein